MKDIREFLTWAASHAVLREPNCTLWINREVVGKDPWQYLYGTTGVLCTQELLDRKWRDYYSKNWSKADYKKVTEGWPSNVIVCDCQGLEDHYSCSDTNARGAYAKYCSAEYKGAIEDIVREYVCGEVLFCGSEPEKINHVAWAIGVAADGELLILHERGLAHGCVIERISKSGKTFKFRGLMDKRYKYSVVAAGYTVQDTEDVPDERELYLQAPMLRGDDVKALQQRLVALGFAVGTIDGIYGKKTDAAVREYQSYAADVIPGVVSEATVKLLGL